MLAAFAILLLLFILLALQGVIRNWLRQSR